MPFDWNDLRHFIAVLDHGSTKRAAAALKVDQTTCARRLAALEAALGLALFSRDGGRYTPTADALALADQARQAGTAMAGFEQAAQSLSRSARRTLKITCEEFWAPLIVVPALAHLHDELPDLHVELDVTPDRRDIAGGEADLALRSGLAPDDDVVIWRKLGDDPIGIYCGIDYPDPPTDLTELSAHPFIGHASHVQKLRDAGAEWQFRDIVNSWQAVIGIVSQGNALTILPHVLARTTNRLQLCFELPTNSAHWLVYRTESRQDRAMKRVIAYLEEEFRKFSRAG